MEIRSPTFSSQSTKTFWVNHEIGNELAVHCPAFMPAYTLATRAGASCRHHPRRFQYVLPLMAERMTLTHHLVPFESVFQKVHCIPKCRAVSHPCLGRVVEDSQ